MEEDAFSLYHDYNCMLYLSFPLIKHFIKKWTTWLLCSKNLLVKWVLSADFTKMLTNCHCFGCTERCSCRQVYNLTQHIKLVKALHQINLLILAWERGAFCKSQLRTHTQVHCLDSHAGPEGINSSPQQKQRQVGPLFFSFAEALLRRMTT